MPPVVGILICLGKKSKVANGRVWQKKKTNKREYNQRVWDRGKQINQIKSNQLKPHTSMYGKLSTKRTVHFRISGHLNWARPEAKTNSQQNAHGS